MSQKETFCKDTVNWSHANLLQPTCVQVCRVAVLSGVQCILYCVQRAKYAKVCTFHFLVAVPFDEEQTLSTKCPLTSRVGTHCDQSERNAQCIAVSANHRFVLFRHTMVLFCVALFFPDLPVLNHR